MTRVPSWCLAASGAVLWWLSQPPIGLSGLAWFAAIPWLIYATQDSISIRDHVRFFLIAVVYWAVTMQGIRHAHPAMYAALGAFAIYLACYSLAFVVLVGRVHRGQVFPSIPTWLAVPMIGTGLECIRNYLLTGISAAMIGHTQANNPLVIQIADAFGSYGVTFLVLLVNAAIHHTWIASTQSIIRRYMPLGIAGSLLLASLGYGQWRLNQAKEFAEQNLSGMNIALIGRDEKIVFVQDSQRELEIFDAYLRQSIEAADQISKTGGKLDVIVWPESMYTGSLPWILSVEKVSDPDSQKGPSGASHYRGQTPFPKTQEPASDDLAAIIQENRSQFQRRGAQVQALIRRVTGQADDPHLVVGCTVLEYGEPLKIFSSVVHLGQRGQVIDWYGKTHLVMFGEYIPLIDYLPWVQRFVPPGMGVERGAGPVPMRTGKLTLSPNVCIETAVERITPKHVMQLIDRGESPDAIVNVTNDGWFDGTSIVEHHLRCTQLVAVTCRRPVLISANGGPTAWIDGSGRVIKRLANDEAGSIIANVVTDNRSGLYQTIADWPARVLAAFCLWLTIVPVISRWRLLKGVQAATRQRA